MATRGRPRKVDTIPGPDGDEDGPSVTPDGVPVDPVAAFGTGGDGNGDTGDGTGVAAPKRRGRKPGSGKKAAPLDLGGIEAILFSLHAMGAAALKVPELMLSKEEAGNLAKAIDNVQQHYPIVADPKMLAWVNLAAVVGATYIPRIIVASKRTKVSKPAAALATIPRPADDVRSFNGAYQTATGGEPPIDYGATSTQ